MNELTEETVNLFKDLSIHETVLAADPLNTFDSTLNSGIMLVATGPLLFFQSLKCLLRTICSVNAKNLKKNR